MQWTVLCGFYPGTRKCSFNTLQTSTPLAATSDQIGNFYDPGLFPDLKEVIFFNQLIYQKR